MSPVRHGALLPLIAILAAPITLRIPLTVAAVLVALVITGAVSARLGGAPKHPVWYYNLKADPTSVKIQDGPDPFDVEVRELDGVERAQWWERAVAAYPPYAEYQEKTQRTIPVFLATRRS